jgi:hypothetical protein
LKKAESFNEQVASLKVTDKAAAEKMLQDKAVDAAMKRAQGIKVKDDPNLLKKALKRQEREKRKSQKAWKARSKELTQTKDKRLQKRNDNIAAAKERKLSKGKGSHGKI